MAVGQREWPAVAGQHGHLLVAGGAAVPGTTPGASLLSQLTPRRPTVAANCSRCRAVT